MNEMKPRSAEQATCSAKDELAESDIMRALEYCENSHGCHGEECPLYVTKGSCLQQIMRSALALLREKNAEIERLKAEFGRKKETADGSDS